MAEDRSARSHDLVLKDDGKKDRRGRGALNMHLRSVRSQAGRGLQVANSLYQKGYLRAGR